MLIDRFEPLRSRLRAAASGAILALAVCGPVAAHEYEIGKITVEHPWLRAPNEGETTAHLFMTIENKGDTPDKLVGAKAEKIGKAIMHADPAHIVMPPGIVVPPHAKVTLEPGGAHVGLHDVKKMNPVGWGFELTLVFEKAGEVTIDASVEAPDAKQAHDAEATERWEKAHGAKQEAKPAGHDEHRDDAGQPPAPGAVPDDARHDMHEDHEHMHGGGEHMDEHEHTGARTPDPNVIGMDHGKLDHGVLGAEPSTY